MVLEGKSSQEYPVNAGVSQGSNPGPTLFLLHINDLPDDVICNIAIYAEASDLWQQLDLASELESDPRDTVDWGGKWLVDQSKNTGAIDVKMDGTVLELFIVSIAIGIAQLPLLFL